MERQDELHAYLNDMLAVERDIHAALRRHKSDRAVMQFPQAAQLLQQIEDTTDQHIASLERCLKRLGTSTSTVKQAVGAFLGTVAGLYDKVRDDKVSRILRDDYTALCFACVCYEMLHTTALAMLDQETADLALRNMSEYTPAVMDIGQLLPAIVLQELTREGKLSNSGGFAEQAARNTRDAWSSGAWMSSHA